MPFHFPKQNSSIPKFLRWTKWISWFYYGFDALAVNQWRNVEILDCVDISNSETTATTASNLHHHHSFNNDTHNLKPKQQQMCFETGQDVLHFLALGIQPEWLNFFGILSLMFLLRFIAYLTLLFIARNR